MKTPDHILVGAVAAALPDLFLLGFAWKRRWVGEDDPWVKAHRFLHGSGGVGVAVTLGVLSHLLLDRYSDHASATDPVNQWTRGWVRHA